MKLCMTVPKRIGGTVTRNEFETLKIKVLILFNLQLLIFEGFY